MSVVAPPRNAVDRVSPLRSLHPIGIAALLLAAALVAWIVTVARMQGMDAGPGTDLGGLGWYVGVWVTMMAAMMLPSVAPMVLIFTRISRERHRQGRAGFVPTWIFLVGYLAAWTAYGLLAYGVFRLVTALDSGFLAWDEAGPYVAGGAIAAGHHATVSILSRWTLAADRRGRRLSGVGHANLAAGGLLSGRAGAALGWWAECGGVFSRRTVPGYGRCK